MRLADDIQLNNCLAVHMNNVAYFHYLRQLLYATAKHIFMSIKKAMILSVHRVDARSFVCG